MFSSSLFLFVFSIYAEHSTPCSFVNMSVAPDGPSQVTDHTHSQVLDPPSETALFFST